MCGCVGVWGCVCLWITFHIALLHKCNKLKFARSSLIPVSIVNSLFTNLLSTYITNIVNNKYTPFNYQRYLFYDLTNSLIYVLLFKDVNGSWTSYCCFFNHTGYAMIVYCHDLHGSNKMKALLPTTLIKIFVLKM